MKTDLQNDYRSIFNRLGYPLKTCDGISESTLVKAEKKIGARLPDALRDYYLVAGKEQTLNHAFNQLCTPDEWEVHKGKLVFMAENQAVVVWGVSAIKRQTGDPAVFQGPTVDGEVSRWFPENNKCSKFLKFMLHLQAAYGGGMPCQASARASAGVSAHLKPDWEFIGEVNKMRAYSRNHQVVCLAKWRDFGEVTQHWRVFAGAQTQKDLDTIATDLDLDWD